LPQFEQAELTGVTGAGRRLGSGAPSAVSEMPMRVIVPTRRRLRLLRDMSESWPVTKMLAARDFTLTFKQSALGPVWLVLQPLGMLGAFVVVFDSIADVSTGEVPYAVFSIVGVTVYGFLQLALGFGTRCFVTNKLLVKHVACPRLAVVHAKLLTALIQPVLMTVLTVGVVLVAGWPLPVNVLLWPVMLVWLAVFAWSLVIGLAAANVYFRDIAVLVPYLLQAGLLLSPIAYPLSTAPDALDPFFIANPVTGLVEAWRWCILGADPNLLAIGVSLAWTAVLPVLAWNLFARLEVRFADVI
jgi:lipopolysaccharide transport system permease protein